MTITRGVSNINNSVIRRNPVGRKVPLSENYLEAVSDASKALTKNHQRIREIESKYGIRQSK
jgi:hypothetical protein